MVLDAQFIGLLQVIVYAGAIMVLILFVIMLLNLREEVKRPPRGHGSSASWRRSVSLLFAVVIGRALWLGALVVPGKRRGLRHGVRRLGKELFTRFYYPFEAISLLLVVAMIGAVLLAKRKLIVIDPRLVLVLSAVLFALGAVGVLTRRGAISILMCVELMLNAANLAFITFARIGGGPEAQIYVFFVMTLAAAEAAAGLAIVIALFRLRGTTDVDEINLLKW